MIYLKLFLTFLKIGAFTFGGGYAMIPLINDAVIENGWLTQQQFLNIIAVSESTPGPVVINIATFVGAAQKGVLGSACATLGVVLPSFVIILIVASVLKNFLKYEGVKGFMSGVRPCVAALIIAAGVRIGLSNLLSFSSLGDKFSLNVVGVIVFGIVALISFAYKKVKDKRISPILLIVISASLGIVICTISERLGVAL